MPPSLPQRMSRRTWLRSVAAAAALAACGGSPPRTQPTPGGPTAASTAGVLALQGGQVFVDGTFAGADIFVDGRRITAVGSPPADATRTVDCGSLWLLPGFIDAHVHLQFSNPADVLAGGVTTARDLGSPPSVGLALRGETPLRVLAAGRILTAVGGYPSQSWGSDGTSRQVRDAADAAEAVAEQARAGATIIKVALEPNAGPMFDLPLLEAVVAAARRHDLKVTAHVGSAEALRLVVAAGVDELAHLPLHDVTPAEMEAVAAAGIVVVPTLQISSGADREAALAAFRAAGGVVVFGSDLGNTGTSPGIAVPEVVALLKAGMTPAEVIAAATSVAADHLGLANVGRLERGAAADIVALRGSPLEDPSALDDIAFVLAGGELVAGALPEPEAVPAR